LDDAGCVIHLEARESFMRSPEVSVYVRSNGQDRARAVLDRLAERANTLNPYRGRALRATYGQGLGLTVIELPATATRANVIVDEQVWAEVDLGVTAVRDRHRVLNAHGLGARRGVPLCGIDGGALSELLQAMDSRVGSGVSSELINPLCATQRPAVRWRPSNEDRS
jgi:cell division protease FtsH